MSDTAICAPDDDGHVEIAEVIRRTGLSERSVYRGLRCGDIPSVRVGRRFVIPRQSFEDWWKATQNGASG